MNASCSCVSMFLCIAFDISNFFAPRNHVTIPFILTTFVHFSLHNVQWNGFFSCCAQCTLHSNISWKWKWHSTNEWHYIRIIRIVYVAARHENTIETSPKKNAFTPREWNVRISTIADNPIRALKCLTFGFVVPLSHWLFEQWCGKSNETKATHRNNRW